MNAAAILARWLKGRQQLPAENRLKLAHEKREMERQLRAGGMSRARALAEVSRRFNDKKGAKNADR
jgi:hypothetical protein